MLSCWARCRRLVKRPSVLGPVGLDDFRHRHAEALVDDDDLAARHQAVVDVDVDRLADLAVEFDDGAAAELEKLAHLHGGAAENGGDLYRNVVDRLEVLGVHRRLEVAAAGSIGVQLGELEVLFVVHVLISYVAASAGCRVVSSGLASALMARSLAASISRHERAVSRSAPPSAHSMRQSDSPSCSSTRMMSLPG